MVNRAASAPLAAPEKYILLGIACIFLIGSLFHFIYELTGCHLLVGLFVPINESIFEHIKMVPLPMLIWWGSYALFNKADIRLDAWFTAALISMLIAIVAIPLLYYFYTQAFGIESLAVDILILLVSVGVGQLIGLHYYKYGSGLDYRLSLALMLTVIVIFAILTVIPPRFPIFREPVQGTYGINRQLV